MNSENNTQQITHYDFSIATYNVTQQPSTQMYKYIQCHLDNTTHYHVYTIQHITVHHKSNFYFASLQHEIFKQFNWKHTCESVTVACRTKVLEIIDTFYARQTFLCQCLSFQESERSKCTTVFMLCMHFLTFLLYLVMHWSALHAI